jgi:hypothetical protein
LKVVAGVIVFPGCDDGEGKEAFGVLVTDGVPVEDEHPQGRLSVDLWKEA